MTTANTSSIKQVTVAGGGVLGSQIAMQNAFFGFNVTIFDKEPEKVKERIAKLMPIYAKFYDKSPAQAQVITHAIRYVTDLGEAAAEADLVIEALPEVLDIKNEFYKALASVAPSHTIFASNSSTLIPSQMVEATGRPDKFLALHFANRIWVNNTAEVMGSANTDPAVFDSIVAYAKAIGMVALPLNKEQPGYILNTLLVPFLNAGMHLYANDIADPQTVDKTWMIGTGAPMGPFAIMDIVGVNTIVNISQQKAKTGSKTAERFIQKLQTELIDKGRTGFEVGKGFYDYPNPAYKDPDFLK